MASGVEGAGRTVVVVPCYNEAERLSGDAFLHHLQDHPELDLLFVDDGSRDGTLAMLRELASELPGRIAVIDQQPNRGKAEAVRVGMTAAIQRPGIRYAGYWDADLATPLAAIDDFAALLDALPSVHIVLGSRVQLLGRQIERKAHRHYLGRVFATFASLALRLPVYDTQCGAKMFRVGDRVAGLFDEPFQSGWIFDVELLARHLAAGGAAAEIHELPLQEWRDVGGSKVKPTDFFTAVVRLWGIRRRYRDALRR